MRIRPDRLTVVFVRAGLGPQLLRRNRGLNVPAVPPRDTPCRRGRAHGVVRRGGRCHVRAGRRHGDRDGDHPGSRNGDRTGHLVQRSGRRLQRALRGHAGVRPANHPPCINFPPEVDFVAAPDRDGSASAHFTGCTSTSGRTCTVLVTASKGVTALFVDTENPVATLTSPAQGAVVSSTVNASATATDNVGVSGMDFLVNGVVRVTDTSAPFQATLDVSTLNASSVTVGARAKDTSARTSAVSSRTIMVDNTAPTVGVTGPDGQVYGPGATETWTLTPSDPLSGVASVACSVVPTGQLADLWPVLRWVVEPQRGRDDRRVVRVQGPGHRQRDQRHHGDPHVHRGRDPPDTSVVGGPPVGAVQASTSVTFGVSSSEPGSTFGCRLYRTGTTAPSFAPCTTATTFTASGLTDGPYTFEARATDAVGNVRPQSGDPHLHRGRHPALGERDQKPKRTVKTTRKKAKVAFGFAANETGATFRCSLDGRAYAACPAAVSFKVKVGRHTLSVVGRRRGRQCLADTRNPLEGQARHEASLTPTMASCPARRRCPRSSRTAAPATRTPSTPWAPTSPRSTRERRGSSATSGSPPTATSSACTTATCGVRRARRGLVSDVEPRGPRGARLRVVEEPVGRPRRRGPRPRRSLDRVLTLRKLLETVADYDRRVEVAIETKHPTRYGGLVERRVVELLRDFGWDLPGDGEPPGPGDELLPRGAAADASGWRPAVRLVMLIDKPRHWPMLRRVIGRGLARRAGHRRCSASTPGWRRGSPPPATTCTCGRSTPSRTCGSAWSSGCRRSSPTARRTCWSCSSK